MIKFTLSDLISEIKGIIIQIFQFVYSISDLISDTK